MAADDNHVRGPILRSSNDLVSRFAHVDEFQRRDKLTQTGDQFAAFSLGLRDQIRGRDAGCLFQARLDGMHKRDFGFERGSQFHAELGRMSGKRLAVNGYQYSADVHWDSLSLLGFALVDAEQHAPPARVQGLERC
jgi:hypothetical protein